MVSPVDQCKKLRYVPTTSRSIVPPTVPVRRGNRYYSKMRRNIEFLIY